MKEAGILFLTASLGVLIMAGYPTDPATNNVYDGTPVTIKEMAVAGLDNGREAATAYEFTVAENEETVVEGLYFNDIVTVNAGGSITFVNCGFERGIDYNGSIGSAIVITEDCQFAPNTCVWMLHETTEATIDDTLPRVISVGVPVELAGDSMGTLVSLNQDSLMFNGETYTLDDCALALDAETGAFTEPDADTEYNSIALARWWENGEEVVLLYAMAV